MIKTTRRFILPVFLPNKGCPQMCIYCNQKAVTSYNSFPSEEDDIYRNVLYLLSKYNKSKWKLTPQIAFYGSSFTALDMDIQHYYLQMAINLINTTEISDIRISTRPDFISKKELSFLRDYPVKTIELGVQSLNNKVLTFINRGHTAGDAINSIMLLKENGYEVGVHLMMGLPGDDEASFMVSLNKVIEIGVDFLRIHPTLVLKDTKLERLFLSNRYTPITIGSAVTMLKKAVIVCIKREVAIARIGIHTTDELLSSHSVIAGPLHPALGHLVESEVYLDAICNAINNIKKDRGRDKNGITPLVIKVHTNELSRYIGYKKANIDRLRHLFSCNHIKISGDVNIEKGMFTVNDKRYSILSLLNEMN